MNFQNLIVFDLDGVIIDVSLSYRDTVRQTARLFFQESHGWKDLPDPLFSLTDLDRVKESGDLNNDWDLTFLVISLLFSLIKNPKASEDADSWIRFKQTMRQADIHPLSAFLRSSDQALITLLNQKERVNDRFVSGLYSGDVGTGNIIKQIFQEVYLGKNLFQSTYGMAPAVYTGKGFMTREKLLADASVFKKLSEHGILAIATGRPEAEALYALDFFGLRKYFSVIYTLDDCLASEKRIFHLKRKKVTLSKPNPFMLDAIKEKITDPVGDCYYVGDMPDDMIAASRSKAGFIGIGVTRPAFDKKRRKETLLQAGAVNVIEDIDGLEKLMKKT